VVIFVAELARGTDDARLDLADDDAFDLGATGVIAGGDANGR
jgi:hypothetical protein